MLEQNIYVWMTLKSSDGRGGESTSIVFAGSEEACIDFVRKTAWPTLRPQFKEAYNSNFIWRQLKPNTMYCTISAGREGTNRIVKKFKVNIIKK